MVRKPWSVRRSKDKGNQLPEGKQESKDKNDNGDDNDDDDDNDDNDDDDDDYDDDDDDVGDEDKDENDEEVDDDTYLLVMLPTLLNKDFNFFKLKLKFHRKNGRYCLFRAW
uniref:Uncharacterized protein n=1 Tax=Glossina morsitans morsitans TaxID=37546 RepID=A0A1B0FH24_GLOMM